MILVSAQNETLLELIFEKKKELLELASENGLTNREVVHCSQELDVLIYKAQVSDYWLTK